MAGGNPLELCNEDATARRSNRLGFLSEQILGSHAAHASWVPEVRHLRVCIKLLVVLGA